MSSNTLSQEKSPYLLQHASNPVHWYSWKNDAIKKAQETQKLIFLSIGYSTCHWCHVMEKESFENQEIANIMNENYICIKVDREERPDIDKTYMTFVQTMVGQGGWPLSVWLTPSLKPIFGGTYFPPFSQHHQTGFKDILLAIAKKWKTDKADLESDSTRMSQMIQKEIQSLDTKNKETLSNTSAIQNFEANYNQTMQDCFEYFESKFDPRYGGFSSQPKFPQPVVLDFLLYFDSLSPASNSNNVALSMVELTLKFMSLGGINDHIGKGFHRYSVDGHWKLPHFEKMAYDQAQLLGVFAKTFFHQSIKRNTKSEEIDPQNLNLVVRFKQQAIDIASYVDDQLTYKTDSELAFFSAEDADSLDPHHKKNKREGAFYVWTEKEIQSILADPELYNICKRCFGITENGNIDPRYDAHNELENQNVLCFVNDFETLSKELNLPVSDLELKLSHIYEKLNEVRKQRPRPFKDTKILASWNGLMISGLTCAGILLDQPNFIDRAIKCANFLKNNLIKSDKTLLRSLYYDEQSHATSQLSQPIEGFLEDYAFTIGGLLDLFEATFDDTWLQLATELQTRQDQLFWDTNDGGYFVSALKSSDGQEEGNTDLNTVLRLKDDQDGAEPSGNSVSALNLLRLSNILGEDDSMEGKDFKMKAEKLLRSFAVKLQQFPYALPKLTTAYNIMLSPRTVTIVGDINDAGTKSMLKYAKAFCDIIVPLDPKTAKQSYLLDKNKNLSNIKQINNKPTMYLCQNHVCQPPTNEIPQF